jgi:acetyl esterase/lipase
LKWHDSQSTANLGWLSPRRGIRPNNSQGKDAMNRQPRTLGPRPDQVAATLAVIVATVVLSVATPLQAGDPPATYPHKSVRRIEVGEGPRSYWLFEPAEPTPATAPVVVFNHGWFAVNPGVYGAWIEHLVRKGRIVIAPRYQRDWSTPPANFLPNGLAAVRDALDVLATSPAHVRPDRSKFALMGHSAGGNLSVQMAAVAAEADLPIPKAVIAVFPGEVFPSRKPDLANVPASTLLVVLAGEKDLVVGDQRAREIFTETSAIPLDRKKFILYRSDLRGVPQFRADHLAPTGAHPRFDTGDGLLPTTQMAQAEVNAFDTSGFWRIADITLEAAFAGKTLDEATDKGETFRHLGFWSDGRPVVPPIVGDDLDLIPRVFPRAGIKLIGWPIILPPKDAAILKVEGVERR